MAGERKAQVFGPTTWIKGDRGLMRAHTTDMPKLINMRVYPNGYLGPRPKWLEQEYDVAFADHSNSQRIGMDFRIGTGGLFGTVSSSGVLVIKSSLMEFYSVADGTLIAEEDGTSDTPSVSVFTVPQFVDNDTLVYGGNVLTIGVEGSNIEPYLRSDNAATNANTLFYSGSGTTVFATGIAHQGRVYYFGYHSASETIDDPAGSGGTEATTTYRNKNRLWYSDLYDYATFTDDTQFIDFPFDINGAFSIGASLFIWGYYGDWFMLQGRGDPASGTLNYLGRLSRPAAQEYPVLYNRTGYFLSQDQRRLITFDESGDMDIFSLAHLGIADEGRSLVSGSTRYQLVADPIQETLVMSSTDKDELVRGMYNGVWVEEDWSTIDEDYDAVGGLQYSVITSQSYEILTGFDANTDSSADVMFRPTNLDHLAQTPNGETEAETGVVGTVRLPLIVDPQETLRVERVLIDIEGERLTGEANPAMTVTIERQDGTTLDYELGPEADQLDFTAGGGRDKRRLQYQPSDMDRYTPRAEVILTDIERLAIEQVTVEYTLGTTELS